MPEGDVVWRTAQRLDAALSGRVLVVADLRWPSLANADLTGRNVVETVSRGKHILTRLSPPRVGSGSALTLHSHLRMEGSWRIDRTGARPARQVHSPDVRAVLGNEEWIATGVKLGMLDVVETRYEATLVGHLGPDVLGPDWDPGRVLANLRAGADRVLGEALLDQRVLAGVGTFYLAEALFLAGRSPWTPVSGLDDPDLGRVVERVHGLLRVNRDRVTQVTTGNTRRGRETYVYARSGLPCRRCGMTVRVAPLGRAPEDRVIFYCPACQPGPTPTDDGRPQSPLGSGPRRR